MATFHNFILLRLLFISVSTVAMSHGEADDLIRLPVVSKAADDDSPPYEDVLKIPLDSNHEHWGHGDTGVPSAPGNAQSFGVNGNGKRTSSRDGVFSSPQIRQENDIWNRKSNAAQAAWHKAPGTTKETDLWRQNEEAKDPQDQPRHKSSAWTPKTHSSRQPPTRPNSAGSLTGSAGYNNRKQSNYLCGPTNETCLCIIVHDNLRVNCSYRKFQIFPSLETYNALAIDVSYNRLSQFAFPSLTAFYRLQRVDLTHNEIRRISVFGTNMVATSLERLNLNDNKIDDISDVPFYVFKQLKALSLSKNSLTHISYIPFSGLERLDFLDLSHNQITRLDDAAFSALGRLRTLRLNHNAQLGYANLSPMLFKSLTSLKVLWIQGNSIKTIDQSYPNVALGKLSNLRELAIDGLPGRAELGAELGQLKYLTTLLFGYGGNCFLQNISPSFFNNVKKLETLIFSDCNFTIQPEAFRKIPHLTNYTVQFPRKGYEFCKAFEDLTGLRYTSLQTLALVGFMKGDIKCRSLFGEKSRYIKPLKWLTGLYLDYNYISTIDGEFLENLPKTLVKLSLRGNAFTLADDSWNTLHNFTSLQEIDVREQNLHFSRDTIAYWSDHLSTYNYDSEDEYLKSGALESVEEDLSSDKCSDKSNSPPQLEKYPFHKRKKSNSRPPDDGHFLEESKCNPELEICVPPNLRYLRASGLTQFGKGLLFSNLSSNSLCYLDFSRSYITNWGNGQLPANVEVADLGHNFCNNLDPTFFPENNSLRVLRIQNNHLGHAFSSDENGTTFSRLNKLTHLNIAMNNIFYLSPSFFKNLSNLNFLNVSENKIETVDLDFANTPQLKFIDMTKNTISWITRKSRRQLDAIATGNSLIIDLRYNPLPCTCFGIEILKWMTDSPVGILNRKLMTCETENKDSITLTNVTRMIRHLEKQCLRDPKLILITSFTGALVAIVVVSGMLYKHRWKFIYAINTWLVKRWGFRPQDPQMSPRTYDAYVVYSEDDREFALHTMTEEMESKRGHRLCLEDRDFIPGSFNFNNITRAVQDSCKTLLLLSPEFLRSKDLRYATIMALMEEYGGQTQREVIFLIRYKQVSDKDMTRDLLLLMKKDRYLDYPSHGDDSTDQSFWDRLSAVIGHTQNVQPSEGLE